MLPADDIIINILLCGTVVSLYGAVICFLTFILFDGDLVIIELNRMREELRLNNSIDNQVVDTYVKK